jgi:hypothetical protein
VHAPQCVKPGFEFFIRALVRGDVIRVAAGSLVVNFNFAQSSKRSPSRVTDNRRRFARRQNGLCEGLERFTIRAMPGGFKNNEVPYNVRYMDRP